VIIGKASRFPLILDSLRSNYPDVKIHQQVNTDDSICKGAARHAASFLSQKKLFELRYVNHDEISFRLNKENQSIFND
jgi:hypothetical protein